MASDGQRLPRAWALAAAWRAHATAWTWTVAQWPTPAAHERDAGASLGAVRDQAQRALFLVPACIESVQRRLEAGQSSPDLAADLAACEARLGRLRVMLAEGNELARNFACWRAAQVPRPAGVPAKIRIPLPEQAHVAVITDPDEA